MWVYCYTRFLRLPDVLEKAESRNRRILPMMYFGAYLALEYPVMGPP